MSLLLLDPSDSFVPYARRRNTPAQLTALHDLFDTTPHPTRAQRQALANEIGMELKSVTNWFQNKRQTSRRKAPTSNENNPAKTRSPRSPARHRHRRSKTPLDRPKVSLDHIAALSERPSSTLQSERMPLTPRKSNVKQKNPSGQSELWTHMLSSPTVPPSPDAEEARLAVLSPREKTLFPLDWACLKARQRKWADEDIEGLSTRPVLGRVEDGQVIVPDSILSLHRDVASLNGNNPTPHFEDIEAAITLLGFKTGL